MGHGRADEAGPSLPKDAEEASAGNGRALSSVPTFLERRTYQGIDTIIGHTTAYYGFGL